MASPPWSLILWGKESAFGVGFSPTVLEESRSWGSALTFAACCFLTVCSLFSASLGTSGQSFLPFQ